MAHLVEHGIWLLICALFIFVVLPLGGMAVSGFLAIVASFMHSKDETRTAGSAGSFSFKGLAFKGSLPLALIFLAIIIAIMYHNN